MNLISVSHLNSETKETKCNLFDRFVSFPYNDRYASVFRRPEERNFYRFFLAFDFLSYLASYECARQWMHQFARLVHGVLVSTNR